MKNDSEQFWGKFENPTAEYRTAPLWVWNDRMQEKQIRYQLLQLKQHGFGGAFIHPRPGLITEYLSDEWFEKWEYAVSVAKELSLKLYIYDENSYPSGFAGGHVSAELPDCWATSISYSIISSSQSVQYGLSENNTNWFETGDMVRAYTCKNEQDTVRIIDDITYVPRSEWGGFEKDLFIVKLIQSQTTSWLADFAYVDILRPEVTTCFLENTYNTYFEKLGNEFGKVIPAIFTDEPAINGSRIYDKETKGDLPFSYWFAFEFEKRNGYSLLDHIPAIFKDVVCDSFKKPARKIRYDYYNTIQELWLKNFIQPISSWCEKHNVAMTGHFMEHLWPLAGGECVSPSIMQNYAYQQWPGIDLLQSQVLKDKPSDLLLVTLLELRSVANQFQKKRTLCESFGAGGWDSTLSDYKRIGDWLLVNGINFINEHLTYATIAGARKRDHPQSFDWREPWWDDYTALNDYFARISFILSQGISKQRILVLHPTTTGYLVAREDEDSNIMWGKPPRNPDMQSYLELIQFLTDRQWDFDLGDEGLIKKHGSVINRKLVIECQAYDIVLISKDMKNMERTTYDTLCQFLEHGGTIISHGKPGGYIDGEENLSLFDDLMHRDNFIMVSVFSELHQKLSLKIPPRIECSEAVPTGCTHMRREFEDGSIVYFFVNQSMGQLQALLKLRAKQVELLNCWTGEKKKLEYEEKEDSIIFPVSLMRNETIMLYVDPIPAKRGESDSIRTDVHFERNMKDHKMRTGRKIDLVSVELEEMNMLTIDYCDLAFDSQVYTDMNVIHGGTALYRNRGFRQNPWDNSVQFKKRILDRNTFEKGSGFSADYWFYIDEHIDKIPKLQAVIERASYYSIEINGNKVTASEDEYCLDPHFEVVDLHAFAKPGRNRITISVDTFDVMLELESIYIRGNFLVETRDKHWIITGGGDKGLHIGSWKAQGYPFYPFAVRYTYKLTSEYQKEISLVMPEFTGTSCSLAINGKKISEIYSKTPIPIGDYISKGENFISLRLSGSYKNLLGPHHDASSPRNSAWPRMWKKAQVFRQPEPEKYDLIDYGLYCDPIILEGV